MFELNNFDAIQISLASPDKIREWSYGEVTKPETINYRTQKPEKDGLFSERIFGPTKDWECYCGKYKRVRYKGVICDKCGVEVTQSKVRRERMGHIELAAPVTHSWYFRGSPSRIGMLLDIQVKQLEQVVYFVNYIVLDPGITDLSEKQIISDDVKSQYEERFGPKSFRVGMGAEAISELLKKIDVKKEYEETRKLVDTSKGQTKIRAIKRLGILDAFVSSGAQPSWMVLDVLPVLPPDLRPMVQLDGGRYATSDLNDLYRRVINRNNRLRRLQELNAPDIIIRNEKRMLQEAVDSLIDNGRRGRPIQGASNRDLKSLTGLLRGKQGRFRQNLLGKRVDYSGRSVIVIGPELRMYQCGLPKEMALELFKPFVMKELVAQGKSHNVKNAKRIVDRAGKDVWNVLEKVIKDHPVLLNRAPTLHRLGIQAFEPVLVDGRAIKLHPLACGAFNADFDGDQMAVHVPLSIEAQAEARVLMIASNNILKLSDGEPVCTPTQDMVLGAFYLTMDDPDSRNKDAANKPLKTFCDIDEAAMAYANKQIKLQTLINVRVEKEINGTVRRKIITTTLGRLIFNSAIPQDLGFVKRNWAAKEGTPEYATLFEPEIGRRVDKGLLKKIISTAFKLKGAHITSVMLDNMKSMGYKYSTISAITTSVFDMHIPAQKKDILASAEAKVVDIEHQLERGFLTEDERYRMVCHEWEDADRKLKTAIKETLDDYNPIKMMADSGARGSMDQIAQLCGMRGLMRNPQGKTIDVPIRSSFREGLSVLEYFISSHGGRKGLADTALKTAESGYLTRRLVDVSQDVIIREDDCCEGEEPKGMITTAIVEDNEVIEKLSERLTGRYSAEKVVNKKTGKTIVEANEYITEDKAAELEAYEAIKDKSEHAGVSIRTVLTCKSKHGVCAKCYGKDMSNLKPVSIGEAVGIIAAQSIGEPGTQLTMRTFHSGGVAAADDITTGLPRVEELFEARCPKHVAVMAQYGGKVRIVEKDGKRDVIVKREDGTEDSYSIPHGARFKPEIFDGATINTGDAITEGPLNPGDLLKTKGRIAVQDYILKEVQTVYRKQSVHISDKHIEIIVRQMLKKVKVEKSGDTELLAGQMVDRSVFESANMTALTNFGRPAQAQNTLLGITKAALATDSFLSAASFQETARVLTEASIQNKIDPLIGLKENVIIGKLIPAGTGMKCYRNVYPVERLEPVEDAADKTAIE